MTARVKLSPEDVERIRTLFLRGETRKEIAFEYPKVSYQYICDILKGRRRNG